MGIKKGNGSSYMYDLAELVSGNVGVHRLLEISAGKIDAPVYCLVRGAQLSLRNLLLKSPDYNYIELESLGQND